MEHTCYRCGEPVEEGVVFCPNCNAPQIRVAMVTENEPATLPLTPGTPDGVQPPALPAVSYGTLSPPQRFRWQDALPGAALAGVVAGFAWMLPPIGYLLWPITAGVLGVFLYKRRLPETSVSNAAGARIGAVTGAFGFAIFAVLAAVSVITMGQAKFRETLNQAFQQAAARNSDPQAQEIMQRFMTPQGIATMFALVAIIFFILFVGLSSLGGMLGAKMTRKKNEGPGIRG